MLSSPLPGRDASEIQVPYEILRSLKRKIKHARVDLVRFRGGVAVCKSYKPKYIDKLENEIRGLRLGEQIGNAPALLEQGDLYVVMEYLEGYRMLTKNAMGMIPLALAKQTFKHLKTMHNAGYSSLDFHVSNVMTDGKEIVFIDYEWLYDYRTYWPDFYESPAILGHRYFSQDGKAFTYEPDRIASFKARWYSSYQKNWRDQVGVDLQLLLEDPLPTILIHRSAYIARHKMPKLLERARRLVAPRRPEA